MAYQASDDAHVELPERCLLKRPKLAALLGVVASEWAGLESDLTYLYATLLGKYLPHNQRKGPPIHPVGFQIFDALESLHKRLLLIERLADVLICDKILLDELKKILLPLIKKASKKRNDLIHAYWGINDTKYPEALILPSLSKRWMVYEASDFEQAIDLILAASTAITKFENNIVKYLRGRKRPISKF